MSWPTELLIMSVVLFAFLGAGAWISVALGAAGMIGLLLHSGPPALLGGVPGIVWNTSTEFVLTAVPMFLLMGQVIIDSRLSSKFYSAVAKWLRSVPGSLLHTNIVSTGLFAAISGSSAATAAAVAPAAIPELTRRRYEPRIVYGSLAAGGTLGILIPPSVPLILYGSMTQQPVPQLFMAGLIPGVIMMLSFMALIGLRVFRQPSLAGPVEPSVPWSERIRSLRDIAPVSLLIVLTMGSLYLGLLTPTEAASFGALVAVTTAFAFGEYSLARLWSSAVRTLRTTSMVVFIVFGAKIFGFALVNAGITRGLVQVLGDLRLDRVQILIAIILLYLVLGTLMDGLAMMTLTLPVLYPVVLAYGFDPIWFAVVLVILLEVGGITPPVGMNLFIIQGVSGASMAQVARGALPFVGVQMAVLLVVWVFPQLALWLPGTMR